MLIDTYGGAEYVLSATHVLILVYFHILMQWIRIRSSDPVFLGHPDPDLDPGKYRIFIHKKTPVI